MIGLHMNDKIKQSVAIIITDDIGNILVEKYNMDYIINRYKDKYEIDFEWSLPVGKVDKEDKNIGYTAIREAHEELGIKVIDTTILFAETLKIQKYMIECSYFIIDSYRGSIINKEPEKHTKLEFMPIDKIRSLKVNAMTKLFLERSDIFHFENAPSVNISMDL